jgi:hypothetical protein
MNARKLFSPRALALLLCLALCAALLAGCGGSSGGSGGGSAGEAGGLFAENAPTLWNKGVSIEAVHLPESAFEEDGARLCGLSADGSKALISCCSESYLYDLASGEKTWLIPGDEQTEEALRLNAVGLFRDLPQEEAAKRMEAVQSMKGRELAKLGLSSRGAGRSTLWARDLPGSDGAWMLAVNNGNGFSLMLDTESGKFYSRLEGEYVDARGDQLLALGPRPLGELTLVDRNTGKETPVPTLREDFGVISAAFLPDGGVAALLRDLDMDMDHGQECLVALRDARGKEESYALGKIRYGMEPGFLFCLNEDTLVLRSAQAGVPCDCVLRRSSGELGRLALKKGEVVTVPPAFDDSGRPEALPDGMERAYLAAPLRDGQTLLVQGQDSLGYLYRPASGETQMVMLGVGRDLLPLIVLSNFTYNGYDRLWMSTAPRGEDWHDLYFQFTVKD